MGLKDFNIKNPYEIGYFSVEWKSFRMKKTFRNLALLICTNGIFICYGCSNITRQNIDKKTMEDTLVKDIPLDKKGIPRAYYRNKPTVESLLGLNSLENGFDSLQIRIWYGYGTNDTAQLVVFKKINTIWSGDFYTFIYILNEKGDSILSIDKKIQHKIPQTGWDSFIRKIIVLNILTLPDFHSIPGYMESTDGGTIIVEVGSQKKYRIYSYQLPSIHQNEFKEARDIVQILDLIDSEFQFKRLGKL